MQEVFERLKYRVETVGTRGRKYYNSSNQLHRLAGPAEIHKDYLGWFIQGRAHTAAEFIEQQKRSGILLEDLPDSHWYSLISRCRKD